MVSRFGTLRVIPKAGSNQVVVALVILIITLVVKNESWQTGMLSSWHLYSVCTFNRKE